MPQEDISRIAALRKRRPILRMCLLGLGVGRGVASGRLRRSCQREVRTRDALIQNPLLMK